MSPCNKTAGRLSLGFAAQRRSQVSCASQKKKALNRSTPRSQSGSAGHAAGSHSATPWTGADAWEGGRGGPETGWGAPPPGTYRYGGNASSGRYRGTARFGG